MHAAAFLAASGGSVILQKPPKPDKKPNLPPDSHNGEILGVWLGRCKFFNDEEDFVCVNVRIDDVVACICRWIGDQF